jgi:hypothetical protein
LEEEPQKDGCARGDNGRANRIRDQELKEQLRLRKERISGRILGQTIGLEIVKRTAGSSVQDSKNECQNIVEEPATAQAKE